jgi:Protein of unknown function (DUF541)
MDGLRTVDPIRRGEVQHGITGISGECGIVADNVGLDGFRDHRKGTGQARSMADRAIIHCAIDAEGSSRESAYNDAAESAKSVDDVLASRRETLGRITTAALVVHPKSRWKKGESVRTGWRASRLSTVEVTSTSSGY